MAFIYREFPLCEDDFSRRLDKVIRKFLPQMPLSLIYKALRTGKILVNHKKANGRYTTCAGDVLYVEKNLWENFQKEIEKKDTALSAPVEIIFQNDHILVVNKPYGLPVYGKNKPSVLELVENTVTKKSLSFRPGPLHRLDKTTTGLLFFSQSLTGAQEFSRILQEKSVKKTYSTLLCGHMADTECWEDKIQKEDNKAWTKSSVSSLGKTAITRIFPVKWGFIRGNPVTFAEIEILTGRPHQIRTVCSFHGFPLLGDVKYGGKPFEKYGKTLFLHATDLEIFSDETLPFPKKFHCAPDENFQNLMNLLT